MYNDVQSSHILGMMSTNYEFIEFSPDAQIRPGCRLSTAVCFEFLQIKPILYDEIVEDVLDETDLQAFFTYTNRNVSVKPR